jgi:coatomer subunit beta
MRTKKKTRTVYKKETKNIEKIYQLSGISDPIFVEAKTSIKITGIEIDLVMINQTKSMLQNINIEFTTSQNISKNEKENKNHISVMKTGEVKNIITNFEVNECSNGFICGTVSFNFPGNKGQYSGSIYEMYLGEILFEIKDLLKIPKSWKEETFREKWIALEWENTYSLKKNINENIKEEGKDNSKLIKIRNMICGALNAVVVAEEGNTEYIVSNMVCETMQGDTILINSIIVIDNCFSIECRIRSTAENMVKSISGIVSETIKNITM